MPALARQTPHQNAARAAEAGGPHLKLSAHRTLGFKPAQLRSSLGSGPAKATSDHVCRGAAVAPQKVKHGLFGMGAPKANDIRHCMPSIGLAPPAAGSDGPSSHTARRKVQRSPPSQAFARGETGGLPAGIPI